MAAFNMDLFTYTFLTLQDVYSIDEDLSGAIINYLATMFTVFSTIVVISVVTPGFIFCLIPLIMFYVSEQSVFIVSVFV
jgi:hypothetical protein